MEGIGFGCHRAYRFDGTDGDRRVTGTVYCDPGTSGPWIAMVDGTSIQILMGGRDLAVEEAIRRVLLPEDQRTPATVSKPD
jgi:hypothetical protein